MPLSPATVGSSLTVEPIDVRIVPIHGFRGPASDAEAFEPFNVTTRSCAQADGVIDPATMTAVASAIRRAERRLTSLSLDLNGEVRGLHTGRGAGRARPT